MADPLRGFSGASPADTMHRFCKGMIENVTCLVLKNVPASTIQYHKRHRQTYCKHFPAADFRNGITNLTKISAAEQFGLVLLFIILFQYEEGSVIRRHVVL